MIVMKFRLASYSLLTSLAALCFLGTFPVHAQNSDHVHAFDYDRNAPVDIQEAATEHRDGVAVHDISYASPKGGRVPAQYGTKDSPFLSPARAQQYASIVSESKKFKLYEGAPHALNAEARRDRTAFPSEQLKLPPLAPKIIATVPGLPQPPDENP
jgi:hypothetical protein